MMGRESLDKIVHCDRIESLQIVFVLLLAIDERWQNS